MLRLAALFLASCLLAACVQTSGTDFAVPRPADLVLGTTTSADIVAKYGPAPEQSRRTSDTVAVATDFPKEGRGTPEPGTLVRLKYAYAEKLPLANTVSRGLSVELWDDRLVSYLITVYNAFDPYNFNEDAAAKIGKATATRQSLIATLGQPAGRGIFPMARAPGWERMVWRHRELISGRYVYRNKVFIADLDTTGKVADIQMEIREEAAPLPPPVAAPVFIHVPRGRYRR